MVPLSHSRKLSQSRRVTCPWSHGWSAFTQSLCGFFLHPQGCSGGGVWGAGERALSAGHHLTTTQASRGKKVDSQNTETTGHAWL